MPKSVGEVGGGGGCTVIGYMVIYVTAICQFIEIFHKIINWYNIINCQCYTNIIQVENQNVGLKVCVCVGGGGGGHKHTIGN